MAFTQITDNDFKLYGLEAFPDTPEDPRAALEAFERNVIVPKLNEVLQKIDTLVKGGGDMTQSTYDTNQNGIVDTSEDCEKLSGCWISFTDEDGNPTDEPYIHWLQEVE